MTSENSKDINIQQQLQPYRKLKIPHIVPALHAIDTIEAKPNKTYDDIMELASNYGTVAVSGNRTDEMHLNSQVGINEVLLDYAFDLVASVKQDGENDPRWYSLSAWILGKMNGRKERAMYYALRYKAMCGQDSVDADILINSIQKGLMFQELTQDKELFAQIDAWESTCEYSKIIDAIEAVPETKRTSQLKLLLASAYKNKAVYGDHLSMIIDPRVNRDEQLLQKAIDLALVIDNEEDYDEDCDEDWGLEIGDILYPDLGYYVTAWDYVRRWQVVEPENKYVKKLQRIIDAILG